MQSIVYIKMISFFCECSWSNLKYSDSDAVFIIVLECQPTSDKEMAWADNFGNISNIF